jgi:hypothetical protein
MVNNVTTTVTKKERCQPFDVDGTWCAFWYLAINLQLEAPLKVAMRPSGPLHARVHPFTIWQPHVQY